MSRSSSIPAHQPELPGLTDNNQSQAVALQLPAGAIIAGVDEVGRGALFGPVVAAAVILPDSGLSTLSAAGVTDSKLLSPEQRRVLALQIRSTALCCTIGYASVREIDRLNILQASLLAMKRAVLKLNVEPQLCLVDGNQQIPGLQMPQQTLVKGDQRSLAIASASIVAKVWRDELITRLAIRFPMYHLASNKGYGTPAHRRALQEFGPSSYHRGSFSPCRLTIDRVAAEQKDLLVEE